MKPHILETLPAIFLPFLLLACTAPRQISTPTASSSSPLQEGSKLEFPGPDDQFIVYYNSWPGDDEFYKRMGARYKLIILNTDDLVPPKAIEGDPEKVRAYKTNRIKMLRDAGAMVFAYLSIGEENVQANNNDGYPGDKQGPCNANRCCKNGYASYYIDNGQCKPVVIVKDDSYASAPVNAGRPVWIIKMKQAGKKQMALGSTGLFLDTLDTADPNGAFAWTTPGMMKLLKELNNITSNIIVNRGIALLEKPEFADDYKKLSWAVMYEDFYTEWKEGEGVDLSAEEQTASLTYWAPKLAGKNVLVVDFASCKQLEENSAVVSKQKDAVARVNMTANPKWPNYFGDQNFKEVRYRFKCEK
jgi:endo-alpha-1,4-polygalactosaminidase (GH114 family)